MHVTFVSIGYGELLGVQSLSAVLRAHGHTTSLAHDPALFDDRFDLHVPALARRFDRLDEVVARIVADRPGLVAFSCITATYARARLIARSVRAIRPIRTVFGGTHASAVPAAVMRAPEVDYVCEGEGEYALLELVEAIEGGDGTPRIASIWTRRGPPPYVRPVLQDLDQLPFPDKTLYAGTSPRRGMYGVMTGRGCPYRCSYCFNSYYADLGGRPKSWVRRRSVDNVLAELRTFARDASYIEFHDDIFTYDRDWLARFLPRYRAEVGVPWGCSAHSRWLDVELACMMRGAGCVRVKMGVQSLDELRYRAKTLKRAEKEEDIVRAFQACATAGLRLEVDHILGLPGESEAGKRHALEFYRVNTPARIGAYQLAYFPGTAITEAAIASGHIDEAGARAIEEGHAPNFHDHANDVGYGIAFRLLPMLPKAMRDRLEPELLARIPRMGSVARWTTAVGMLADVSRGGGLDAMNYVRWYAHHLTRPVSCAS